MRDRVRYVLGAFAIATIVALSARFFFVENFRVSSESMKPNLVGGDLLLVTKFNYALRIPFTSIEFFHIRNPQRGEVVVFTLPEYGLETFLKRVVALEGDTIALSHGILTVNGVAAQYEAVSGDLSQELESFPGQTPYAVVPQKSIAGDYGPALVPRGHFFAIGDNRGESRDSRKWGPVPLSYLRGKSWMVWLSLKPGGSIRTDRVGLRVGLRVESRNKKS